MSSRSQLCCFLKEKKFDESQTNVIVQSSRLKRRFAPLVRHTSVMVYGHEFHYFNTGIAYYPNGQSDYGTPVETIGMGETQKSLLEFLLYIEKLGKGKYSQGQYNTMKNNCNDYSNDLCKFLVGDEIPLRLREQSIVLTGGVSGGSAGTGAVVGALFGGPLGAIVGGGIGAIVGLVTGLTGAGVAASSASVVVGASAGAAVSKGSSEGSSAGSSAGLHSAGPLLAKNANCFCVPSCGCSCRTCCCSSSSSSYRKQE